MFSCKGCTKRHPGCHSTCPEYIKEKRIYDEHMRTIRKEQQTLNSIYESRANIRRKAFRKQGKK